MKKILCFTDSLGAGGAQRQLIGLAIMLTQRGYDVRVCYYHDETFFKYMLDDNNIPCELIPHAESAKTRIWNVGQYFRRQNPDWVIAYQETPSLIAAFTRLFWGKKFKLLVSERNTTQSMHMNEHVRFFLYRWANAIVTNSYSQNNFMSNRYPWMRKTISTISNFVDLEHFGFAQHTKGQRPEIVIAASIWPSKNTLGFIEALREVVKTYTDFHVSWYGKSSLNMDYFNKCQALIEQYNLQDYIELKEKTTNISEVYKTANYFCLPSFYEGMPNVICEAMASGLPVVCSDVCDNAKYVQEGGNGYLFNPTDTSNIASALIKALSLDEENYTTFSTNSRKIAEEKLSAKLFVEKYISILES